VACRDPSTPLGPGQLLWRRLAVVGFAAAALVAMGVVFWERDLQYSLPTPRPDGVRDVPLGARPTLPATLAHAIARQPAAPLLLHFYNPDCPCSRFNRDHVEELRRRFAGAVHVVEVLETTPGVTTTSGIDVPHVVDADGAIAAAFGVYATPQAVLLDGERRLRYRGNFNTTRYCSEPKTQFVRLAIEALLGTGAPVTDPRAATAYGCPLPSSPEITEASGDPSR
jgi:hypothetical protein